MGRHNAWQNLELMTFDTVGKYNIPVVNAITEMPDITEWIRFNYSVSKCKNRKDVSNVGINFWVDDYQFERCWNSAVRYKNYLQRFGVVLSPDFSMFMDYPNAINIYNHYRNMWLASYYQQNGIKVIPCAEWVDRDSYDWCFDGMPKHSVVAVSNVGTKRSMLNTDLFNEGYIEMLNRLDPIKVLVFSRHPEKYEGPVEYIEYERWQNGK